MCEPVRVLAPLCVQQGSQPQMHQVKSHWERWLCESLNNPVIL